jgi:hypothetical protein
MSTRPSLDATRSWVLELYVNRLDDYKQKYSEYVFQVVESLEQEFNDIECIQYETAYLQNIMSECNVTKTEILEKGYSKELLTVLELVKKPKVNMSGFEHECWVRQIIGGGNINAIRVKYADIITKINVQRLTGMSKKDVFELRRQYSASQQMLKISCGKSNGLCFQR